MLRYCFIICAFALSYCWSQFAHAEIPFEQVKGIYDATREDQKENSPLWGMVAIHSKVLPHLRFFGPYGSYAKDLAQKFPEKRTAKSLQIIGLIKTPIKPDDNAAKEKIERFKKLKKLYNSYSLAEFADVPQNYIAALIQLLFSSPDGAIFTATVRNSFQDPLYKLVKDGNGQVNLTHMNRLLKTIIDLKTAIKQGAKEEISKAEQAIFELFAGKLTEKEQKTENHPYLAKLDQLKSSQENRDKFLSIYFAHILIQAVKEELTDTKVQSLYPKNICMIALLSYVWKVANKKSDLKPLTTLLSENATLDDQDQFSRKEYQQNKDNFVRVLLAGSTKKDKLINPLSPEMIALFYIGYTTYEERFPSPISYKHDVKYSGYKGGYPDCGETSLRNFFYYIFNQNGFFSQKYFKEFLRKIELGGHAVTKKLQELQAHFKIFPSISAGGTQPAHDNWSEVVSGLDIMGGECPYKFGTEDKCVCNISAARGLFNMLTVIGKLIPDAKLAGPWETDKGKKFQQMAAKLDRLCDLVSRDGFKVDWHIDSEKRITKETGFVLTLTINDEDAFIWNFLPGHFEIKKLTTESGWPGKVFYSNQNFKTYPLLQAWFTQPEDLNGSEHKQIVQPFSIFGQDLRNNNILLNVVDYLFERDHQDYYPLILKWLRPLFQDNHSLNQARVMMLGHSKQLKLFSKEEQEKLKVEESEIDNLLFHYVIPYNYLFSLKTLLAYDKNIVHIKDRDDFTPLHRAAEEGSLEIVKLLLENGSDVNVRNNIDITPLFLAAGRGNIEIVKLLLEKGAEIKHDDTLLHWAASGGHTEIVELFLEKGIKVNARNKQDETSLHEAAKEGRTEVIKLLLKKGAEINAQKHDKSTPLHVAVEVGHTETVRLLLEKGANVNAKDVAGFTPLHLTAISGYFEIAKLLLEKDANVNAKAEGHTPLDIAVLKGNTKIIKLLQAQGEKFGKKL